MIRGFHRPFSYIYIIQSELRLSAPSDLDSERNNNDRIKKMQGFKKAEL